MLLRSHETNLTNVGFRVLIDPQRKAIEHNLGPLLVEQDEVSFPVCNNRCRSATGYNRINQKWHRSARTCGKRVCKWLSPCVCAAAQHERGD